MQNMIAMKIKYKTEKWMLHNLAGANMLAVSSIKATARKSNVTMAFNATRKLRNVHISHFTAAKDWPAWYTAHLHCSSYEMTNVHQQYVNVNTNYYSTVRYDTIVCI